MTQTVSIPVNIPSTDPRIKAFVEFINRPVFLVTTKRLSKLLKKTLSKEDFYRGWVENADMGDKENEEVWDLFMQAANKAGDLRDRQILQELSMGYYYERPKHQQGELL